MTWGTHDSSRIGVIHWMRTISNTFSRMEARLISLYIALLKQRVSAIAFIYIGWNDDALLKALWIVFHLADVIVNLT